MIVAIIVACIVLVTLCAFTWIGAVIGRMR